MTKNVTQPKEFIICPHCGIEIKYQKITQNKVTTHYWICEECPFVGFEYWSPMDINNLKVVTK